MKKVLATTVILCISIVIYKYVETDELKKDSFITKVNELSKRDSPSLAMTSFKGATALDNNEITRVNPKTDELYSELAELDQYLQRNSAKENLKRDDLNERFREELFEAIIKRQTILQKIAFIQIEE